MKNHFLVIDCETTGLDPVENRMITFSAATYRDGYSPDKPRDKFNFYFTDWQEGKIDPAALKVNCYNLSNNPEHLPAYLNKNKFISGNRLQFVHDFINWTMDPNILSSLENNYFVGYNIQFDISFLKQTFFANNFSWPSYLPHKVIDLYVLANSMIACGVMPNMKSVSAKSIYEYFGIIPDDIHSSFGDVKLTWELWQIMSNKFDGFKLNPK